MYLSTSNHVLLSLYLEVSFLTNLYVCIVYNQTILTMNDSIFDGDSLGKYSHDKFISKLTDHVIQENYL